MSQAAMIILGLLIVFPLFYIGGIYIFLRKIARNNRIKITDIVKYLWHKIDSKFILKTVGVVIIFGVGAYTIFLKDIDQNIAFRALVLVNITLLLGALIYSIFGQVRSKKTRLFTVERNFVTCTTDPHTSSDSGDSDWSREYRPGGIYYEANEWMNKMRDL